MGRIIEKIIYCSNSNNRYKAFFEEKEPGKWYGIRAESMEPLSFFERKRKQNEIKNRYKTNSFSSNFKFSTISARAASEARVQGSFYSGTLKCPYGGNTGFVDCGNCHEWTCKSNNVKSFKCAICGNSGNVSR